MRTDRSTKTAIALFLAASLAGLAGPGCASNEKAKDRARESAARYWQEKAYPGKSFDVQVVEAEEAEDGNFRVKGIVDGETRVGLFNPKTETFSEGFYSLSHERSRRIAELEQEVKYWKEKSESLEKDNYKLKVKLNALQGKSLDDDEPAGKAKK
jgi:hypothetical protein